MKLDGKVALVSGAGRGIGRAIAIKLASEGARVVVNDLDTGPANETVNAIRSAGGTAVAGAGAAVTLAIALVIGATALNRSAVQNPGPIDVLSGTSAPETTDHHRLMSAQ